VYGISLHQNEHSFVLVTCDKGHIYDIIEKIQSIPAVIDISHIKGFYDVLVHLNGSNDSTKETINTKIKPIDGITSTLTLFCT